MTKKADTYPRSLFYPVKQAFVYAMPAIVCMLCPAIHNIISRIFIGGSLGTDALSGMALTLPFMVLITAIGAISGTGAATLISHLPHKRDSEAERILGEAFALNLVISLIVISVILLFLEEFVFLFGGRQDTIPYAVAYLKITIPAMFFFNILIGFGNCMRACGYEKKVTRILLSGLCVNLLLHSGFHLAGILNIETTAWATLISVAITSVPVILHFINHRSNLRIRRKYLRLKAISSYKIILSGMTTFFMNLTICTVSIIMNNYLVVHGGSDAIGAYGIISSFSMPLLMTIAGLCQGMQTRRKRGGNNANRLFASTLYAVLIVGTGGLAVGILFPDAFIRLFTRDMAIGNMARHGLQITISTLPLLGIQQLIAATLQNARRMAKAIFVNMSRQFIFLIPLLQIFSGLWSTDGIWMAVPVADLLAVSCASCIFLVSKPKIREALKIEVESEGV